MEAELRAVLGSGDDYASAAKPQIDWDDAGAGGALIDSRARDAFACLALLHGRVLSVEAAEAAELLAAVVGQDLDEGGDGVFRIARRVAKDRVISTVDPQARHGHKTSARGFDGYKGHVATDPDSEIVTSTRASPGNAGDASVAADLIDDLVARPAHGDRHDGDGDASHYVSHDGDGDGDADGGGGEGPASGEDGDGGPKVYGDAAYGAGEFLDWLAEHDIVSRCKTQPPTAAGGLFTKDRFVIDLGEDTVTCPAGVTVAVRRSADGGGTACFAGACAGCPLRPQCTDARGGRTIRVRRHEQRLADARRAQQDPAWAADLMSSRG